MPRSSTPSGASSLGSGPGRSGAVAAERAHDDDAEPELLGERQDLPLDLALARVERDLDRVDPPGSHDARELVERRGRVVGRTEEADAAGVPLALEPVEVLAPGDEVVHLLEIDAAAVEAELSLELRAGPRRPTASRSSWRRTPRSRRPRERAAEHPLGASVHRRRVDEPSSRPSKAASTTASATGWSSSARSSVAQVPSPTTGSSTPVRPRVRLSILSATCPRRAYSTPPSSPRPASTSAPPARTSPSPRCSRPLGPPASAGGVRLRAARRQPRRRGRRRPRRAARRARAGARGAAEHGDHAPAPRDDRRRVGCRSSRFAA